MTFLWKITKGTIDLTKLKNKKYYGEDVNNLLQDMKDKKIYF
jgi:hypothetical protein